MGVLRRQTGKRFVVKGKRQERNTAVALEEDNQVVRAQSQYANKAEANLSHWIRACAWSGPNRRRGAQFNRRTLLVVGFWRGSGHDTLFIELSCPPGSASLVRVRPSVRASERTNERTKERERSNKRAKVKREQLQQAPANTLKFDRSIHPSVEHSAACLSWPQIVRQRTWPNSLQRRRIWLQPRR